MFYSCGARFWTNEISQGAGLHKAAAGLDTVRQEKKIFGEGMTKCLCE